MGRERHQAVATPQRAILQMAFTTRGEPLCSAARSHTGVMWRRCGRLSVLVGCAPQADEEVRLWDGAKVAAVILKTLHRHLTPIPVWTCQT